MENKYTKRRWKMKQIIKKEAKCFKHDKSARVEVNGIELKKFAGKRVLVKIFAIKKKRR
jgi:hypothetical protein